MMMRLPMVNMAKTPDDVKKEIGDLYPGAPASSTTSAYPYGLCISLDDETLKKLGLSDDMPGVGEMMHFGAIARVTSASQNEREKADGSKEMCCRIELQITDMGVLSAEPDAMEQSAARRKRFYGEPASED